MNQALSNALIALRTANEKFARHEISPVAHAREREAAVAKALRAVAADHQVQLQEPLSIDSNGEFSIIALGDDGQVTCRGGGRFGDAFAELLTRNRARTGWPGPNVILGCNGWCRLNHFEAEKMVSTYYDQLVVFETAGPESKIS